MVNPGYFVENSKILDLKSFPQKVQVVLLHNSEANNARCVC
jgi:hypothetical protein